MNLSSSIKPMILLSRHVPQTLLCDPNAHFSSKPAPSSTQQSLRPQGENSSEAMASIQAGRRCRHGQGPGSKGAEGPSQVARVRPRWMHGWPIARIIRDITGYRSWPFALAVNKMCARDRVLLPLYVWLNGFHARYLLEYVTKSSHPSKEIFGCLLAGEVERSRRRFSV